jgi:hypothetical protein
MHYSAEGFHLIALLCTLGIEATGMALWAWRANPDPWRAIRCAIVVNLIIHTLFWYTQPLFVSPWPLALYVQECLVVMLEGAIYARYLALRGITPWLLSLLLNSASFITGLLLWQFLL